MHWATLCAESEGAAECLALLLEQHHDALSRESLYNLQSNSGSTPLHCALSRGHERCVQMLVQKGVDQTIKDEDGKTAKDLAKAHSKAMVKVLAGKK